MTRALDGIRVLDLSRVLAGPFCSMVLSDLGAEVIKVERDGLGDDLRGWGPPFMPDGESTYFLSVNRNKRSIVLDLKSEAGRALVLDLVRKSDVVLENFRPGVMESLGLGYDELRAANPQIIFCSISGFGTKGPMAGRPGYDVITQGMGGLMSVTGEADGTPMRVGVAIVDLVTGLYSVIGILGALQSRTTHGHGQRVDLSLLESCLSIMPNMTAGYLMGGALPPRMGNGHPNTVPYKTFPTKDSFLTLAIGNDEQWRRLCKVTGHAEMADDARFAINQDRVALREEVETLVVEWLSERTTDEWVEVMETAGVPCGPVYTVDRILGDAQVDALGLVKTMVHPTSGEIRVVGAPFHLSLDDTEPYRPPPTLGAHTAEILSEVLGLDDDAIRKLADQQVFGSHGIPKFENADVQGDEA
ncbi:CaiB/BaiF CoA transferase family protein [Sphingobium subterraneum]|uniref:Formyl-CoA transferase n=1 Tax=Sphingobium subterraneum TaxID=627688 RepID=A0A841IX69_9SPHN|nr:CoA transferase [Sphingobium subterraneum]MBB6122964.1 formyl-CoA transferase [Sphingobium subterraneum]